MLKDFERGCGSQIKNPENKHEFFRTCLLFVFQHFVGIKDVNADHAASHIGRAQGLATILRAIPYNAQHKRVNLPLDVMAKVSLVNVSMRRVSGGGP